MRIKRWRVRQRRRVRESIWMYTAFTRKEARGVARLIRYSPVRAARLINAYARDRQLKAGRSG